MRLPKKPRPNTRIDACYVQADLKPLMHPYANSDDFQKKRFQYYAPTHGTGVAIGSTFLKARANGETHVLDASTIIYTTGEHGNRTGVLMALADGCGKVDSEDQNLSTGLVAKSACDYLVDEAKGQDNSTTLMNKVLIAGQKSLKAKRADNYESDSTLIGAAIGSYKGAFVNVGDGVLIVIDGKTHQVKKILNPQQKYIKSFMGSNYTPTNAQELINKPAFQQYIDAADLKLSADDIVVMTSDGVTDVLPTRRITKTVEVKELKSYTDSSNNTTSSAPPSTNKFEHQVKEIDIDFLNNMLEKIFENLHSVYPNQQPPAFAVANELVRLTVESTVAEKDAKVNLANKLKHSINAYQEKVIAKNRNDYEELLKKNRLSYVNLKDRIINHMPIVNSFLTTLFIKEEKNAVIKVGPSETPIQLTTSNNEYTAILKEGVLQDFTQKLTAKLLPKPNSSGKDKQLAQERAKLNIAQIKDIIKEVIQNLFEPSSPLAIDHIQIIASIFLKEINELAEKFSGRSLSEKLIHGSVEEFLVSISLHQPRQISLFLQQMSQKQQKYEEYMLKWANQEKGFTNGLPEIIIKFFKEEIYPLKSEGEVKQEIAQLLPYVSCIDFERDNERARIPLPQKHTIGDFQTWLATENAPLNAELNQFIDEYKINHKAPFECLMRDLDVNGMKFGDDTSIAVAYVPDPAVELVRAMIEYPNKREQLWTELNCLRPTNELLENIYKRLLNEKHVDIAEQTNLRHERQTVGQNADVLSNKIVSSYSEDEILNIKQFLLTKIKLKTECDAIIDIKKLDGKANAQRTLNLLLNNHGFSVLERCALYNQLGAEQFANLNEHRHSGIDSFFGINTTRSWSQSLKAIRQNILQTLDAEIRQLISHHKYDEALAILNKSLEEPLFNTHRNNSKITGAFGDTAAVKEIRRMIVYVTSQRDTYEARNRIRS